MIIYMSVPYSEKDEAKSLGARWSSDKKSWFIDSNQVEKKLFYRWMTCDDIKRKVAKTQVTMRTYLNVPIEEKDEAKSLGARWDLSQKRWYIENIEDITDFMRWMPDHLMQPNRERTKSRDKKIERSC